MSRLLIAVRCAALVKALRLILQLTFFRHKTSHSLDIILVTSLNYNYAPKAPLPPVSGSPTRAVPPFLRVPVPFVSAPAHEKGEAKGPKGAAAYG